MSDESIEEAAITLQAAFRGRRDRLEVKQQRLATATRWSEIFTDLKMKQVMQSQSSARRNSITDRFQRAGFLASRLQDGEGVKSPAKDQDPTHVSAKVQEMLARKEEGGEEETAENVFNLDFITKAKFKKRAIERRLQGRVGPDQKPPQALQEKQSKRLEEQHWLEMIDTKHRYGANLKWYHKVWSESGTTENFFRWLDFGEGRRIDLDECPRERLDKEQIFYCSAEQRLNYLVVPNPATGLLHWAKNGDPVDTAPGRWQDSGDGSGIIPLQKDGEAHEGEGLQDDRSTISSGSSAWTSFDSPSSSDDGLNPEEAQRRRDDAHHYAHYMVDSEDKKSHKAHKFTTHGLMDRLLRKTVGKNTWIYVSDMQYNVFVGIKTTGTFQHSSFLSGGLVASAGLVRVRNGQITALSPLSGHYRSSMNHFKIFLNEMEKQGLNLDKVKVGKSEVMLWGLETYGNISKKHKQRKERASGAVHRLAEKLHISETHDENKAPST